MATAATLPMAVLKRATSLRDFRASAATVSALGLTQIVGYGTLYYSFSILAPGMAKDLGLTLSQVFAVFRCPFLSAVFRQPISVGRWTGSAPQP